MGETIRIPAPVAYPGTKVMVENYRTRDGRHERGTVTDLRCTWWTSVGWVWTYMVELDRRSAAGNLLRLDVGDDEIRVAS